MKINSIPIEKNIFLQRLENIAKPPEMLHFMGELPDEQRPVVAIVGTRKPSAYGHEVTARIAGELTRAGVIIVSGLALGVDSLAHKAAIEAGGITVAVVPSGLPQIYPASHRGLADTIISHHGAIISEWKKEDNPTIARWSFLARNRLVSGLADAIIITEAAERSGTLNTASHALEQGKDIFVVPGNITSPLSAGCNALLKQGAMPLTDVADVLSVIAPDYADYDHKTTSQTSSTATHTPEEAAILHALQHGERDGEKLQQQSGLDIVVFNTTLTMLELNGDIVPLGANQWRLK